MLAPLAVQNVQPPVPSTNQLFGYKHTFRTVSVSQALNWHVLMRNEKVFNIAGVPQEISSRVPASAHQKKQWIKDAVDAYTAGTRQEAEHPDVSLMEEVEEPLSQETVFVDTKLSRVRLYKVTEPPRIQRKRSFKKADVDREVMRRINQVKQQLRPSSIPTPPPPASPPAHKPRALSTESSLNNIDEGAEDEERTPIMSHLRRNPSLQNNVLRHRDAAVSQASLPRLPLDLLNGCPDLPLPQPQSQPTHLNDTHIGAKTSSPRALLQMDYSPAEARRFASLMHSQYPALLAAFDKKVDSGILQQIVTAKGSSARHLIRPTSPAPKHSRTPTAPIIGNGNGNDNGNGSMKPLGDAARPMSAPSAGRRARYSAYQKVEPYQLPSQFQHAQNNIHQTFLSRGAINSAHSRPQSAVSARMPRERISTPLQVAGSAYMVSPKSDAR
eukprot:GILJ01008677.1.p1 GENE.GILJ01008677.1~~GILJ01008677.1.p1  ORF type:complete len:456 (+),score=45.75 GILJ01008677.1:48-1370(+)